MKVYRVSASTLQQLDRLEDVPRMYRRVEVTLPGLGRAQTYLLANRFVARLTAGHRRRLAHQGVYEW